MQRAVRRKRYQHYRNFQGSPVVDTAEGSGSCDGDGAPTVVGGEVNS